MGQDNMLLFMFAMGVVGFVTGMLILDGDKPHYDQTNAVEIANRSVDKQSELINKRQFVVRSFFNSRVPTDFH